MGSVGYIEVFYYGLLPSFGTYFEMSVVVLWTQFLCSPNPILKHFAQNSGLFELIFGCLCLTLTSYVNSKITTGRVVKTFSNASEFYSIIENQSKVQHYTTDTSNHL